MIKYFFPDKKKSIINTEDKPKRKRRSLYSSKEIVGYLNTLSVGLSFGSGILGCVYLLNMGLPLPMVAIFGLGVVLIHLDVMKDKVSKDG